MVKKFKELLRDFGSFAKKKLIDEPKEAQAVAEAQAKRAAQLRQRISLYLEYGWFVFEWLRDRYADYGVKKPLKFRELFCYDIFTTKIIPPRSFSFYIIPRDEYFDAKMLRDNIEFSFIRKYPEAGRNIEVAITKYGNRYRLTFDNPTCLPSTSLVFSCKTMEMLLRDNNTYSVVRKIKEGEFFDILNPDTGEFIRTTWHILVDRFSGVCTLNDGIHSYETPFIPKSDSTLYIATPAYIMPQG